MIEKPLKAFLFFAGACVAALLTAYGSGALDPYLYGTAPKVTSAPDRTKSPDDATAKPAAKVGDSGKETEEPAGTTEKTAGDAPASAPQKTVPSFDVVRVEPNGSVVVAGKAMPDTRIEILSGSDVIGDAKADAVGDFAIVFDDPLKPGDYQLKLRTALPGQAPVLSSETAIVSIPKTSNGQVLAMVEAPGKPSQVITQPQAEKPVTDDKSEDEAKPIASVDNSDAATAGASDGDSGASTPVAGAAPEQPASGAQSNQQPAQTAGTEPAGGGAAEKPASDANTAQATAVQAVEIEGRNIFVAGTAEPGRTVRVYADEILLGEAVVAPNGRFLVETERDLPVGDYVIRLDVLGNGGKKVIARAAVPFEREPGESIAAVAAPAAPAAPTAEASGNAKEARPDVMAAAETPASGQQASDKSATSTPSGPDDQAKSEQPATVEMQASEQPGSASNSAGSAKLPEIGDEIAGTPPELTAAKLQPVQDAVIIRRGDTLWRISRRVYGRGVRYSTIYLANRDQIADPDMIWPGQVFAVPDTTQEGESADMSAIGDQVTTKEK